MSYIGRVEQKASDIKRFDVTSSTSATHTLSWAPVNEQSCIVTINGVKQHEDAYSVSGTTLTLTSPLVATDKLEVIGIQDVGQTVVPGTGVIVDSMVSGSAAIAMSKLATDPTNASNISSGTLATARLGSGTADSTTFLRGDQTWAEAGGGKVLQVVSTNSNSTETFVSASGWVDTNLTVNITPASSSNKVLVLVNSHWGGDNKVMAKIVRDSTDISVGATAGSRTLCSGYDQATTVNNMFGLHFSYLDSPATTSQITYKVQGIAFTNGSLNRSNGDADEVSRGRTASSITVMEIAG